MTPCMISLAIRAGSSGYRVRSHHHGGTPNLSDSFEISRASHLRHSASSLLMFLRTILVLQNNSLTVVSVVSHPSHSQSLVPLRFQKPGEPEVSQTAKLSMSHFDCKMSVTNASTSRLVLVLLSLHDCDKPPINQA